MSRRPPGSPMIIDEKGSPIIIDEGKGADEGEGTDEGEDNERVGQITVHQGVVESSLRGDKIHLVPEHARS